MFWIALQPQPDDRAPPRRGADSWAAAAEATTGAGKPDAHGARGRATLSTEPELVDAATALGWWALQYTPKVALLAGAVLLEVSASTRLWGGRAALLRHLHTAAKPVALAGVAQGETSLLALGRLCQLPASASQTLQQPALQADDLPLSALLAARPHLDTLARLGCNRWGDLRALPRGGVARRFGATLVDALDQAYGQRPDVYPWLTLPEAFAATLELPSPVDSAPALLFGARRLLAQLQLWLHLRQLGVLAVELGWQMDPRRHTATQGALQLRSAQASADTQHLQRLLAERLAQVTLPAPVLQLRLRSLETQALTGASASLLPDDQPQGDSLAHLLERLSARLGAHQVLQLHPQADHRPEQMQLWRPASPAWHPSAKPKHHPPTSPARARQAAGDVSQQRAPSAGAGTGSTSSAGAGAGFGLGLVPENGSGPGSDSATRWASPLWPTWLLAEPVPLAVFQHQAHDQGPLTLLSGPHRLEAGWWAAPPQAPARQAGATATGTPRPAEGADAPAGKSSGTAVLRDYFVARHASAQLLWIYRERLAPSGANQPPAAWYLHGLFA